MVIAGYLVWIRSKYQPPIFPGGAEQVIVTPTASPAEEPATPSVGEDEEATGSMKQETATSSSSDR